MMALNQLPPEVAVNILLHLKPSDRMRASTTCRTWAEAVSYAEALSDVWLVIYGFDLERGISSTVSGSRQYSSIRIIRADLRELRPEFLSLLGSRVRQLEFIGCQMESDSFCEILKHCPRLRSLSFKGNEEDGSHRLSTLKPTRSLPADEAPEGLQKLRSCFRESAQISSLVESFFALIPEVKSITVDKLSTFEELKICLLTGELVFTKLDFSTAPLCDQRVSSALELYSKCLKDLRLNGRTLSSWIYSKIGECSKLTNLLLHQAFTLCDSALHSIIVGAPKLESLSLGGCHQVTNEVLVHISDLKRLRRLHLKDCISISPDTFVALSHSKSLESLAFGSSLVDSKNLRELRDLSNLRELCLAVNVTRDCFDEICRNFENLEKLQLGSCARLTDVEGMKFCLFVRLKSLIFTDGIHFTNRTFERGLGSPQMKHLSITNTHLTERALASIGSHHPCLEELALRKCPSVTDKGMRDLLPLLGNLRKLALPSCTSLTGDCLVVLADSCPRIRFVEMHDSPTISCRAKRFFRKRKPRVKISYSKCQ